MKTPRAIVESFVPAPKDQDRLCKYLRDFEGYAPTAPNSAALLGNLTQDKARRLLMALADEGYACLFDLYYHDCLPEGPYIRVFTWNEFQPFMCPECEEDVQEEDGTYYVTFGYSIPKGTFVD